MENLINNPGLQHLAENIFLNLNYGDLKKCQLINQSTSHILDNPMLCIKALIQKGLSKEDQKDWIEAIQSEKNSEKKKAIATYLKWNLNTKERRNEKKKKKKKKKVGSRSHLEEDQGDLKIFNLPCYTMPNVQEEFRNKIRKISGEHTENAECVKILATLTYNPNTPNWEGRTPIYYAAQRGHTEIVKILAPLTDNPNAPDHSLRIRYAKFPVKRSFDRKYSRF